MNVYLSSHQGKKLYFRNMQKHLYVIFAFLPMYLSGQVNVQDSTTQGWLFNIQTAYQWKGGDFSEYLTSNWALGLDLQYKLKSNWIVSVGGRYRFSDNLRNPDDMFDEVLTANGWVLGLNGEYANVTFRERGFDITADVIKVFNRWGHNSNSGPYIRLGAGYSAHWISIRNPEENTPQVQDDYSNGYDRRHQGLLTRQQIGYFYAGSNKKINFTLGFEVMQGFSQNVRGFNYSSREFDSGSKLDLYYGITFSWFLPIYNQNAQKYYYY